MEQEQKNVTNFDDVKKRLKKEELKRKFNDFVSQAKIKIEAAIEWGLEHPGEVLGLITGVGVITKNVVKHQTSRAEDRRRATEFFEHSSGKWAKAKRKLTSREQLEAETRHKNGETWTEILADMRLLK